jgi:hypothetical protein
MCPVRKCWISYRREHVDTWFFGTPLRSYVNAYSMDELGFGEESLGFEKNFARAARHWVGPPFF